MSCSLLLFGGLDLGLRRILRGFCFLGCLRLRIGCFLGCLRLRLGLRRCGLGLSRVLGFGFLLGGLRGGLCRLRSSLGVGSCFGFFLGGLVLGGGFGLGRLCCRFGLRHGLGLGF